MKNKQVAPEVDKEILLVSSEQKVLSPTALNKLERTNTPGTRDQLLSDQLRRYTLSLRPWLHYANYLPRQIII